MGSVEHDGTPEPWPSENVNIEPEEGFCIYIYIYCCPCLKGPVSGSVLVSGAQSKQATVPFSCSTARASPPVSVGASKHARSQCRGLGGQKRCCAATMQDASQTP